MVSPFTSVILAVLNCRDRTFKNVIWIFCAFYGYTFVLYPSTSDAQSHVNEFEQLAKESDLTFEEYSIRFWSKEGGDADVLIPLIKFGLSRVTSNHRVLLCIMGFLLGYFFSRNVWNLLKIVNKPLLKLGILTLLLYSFIWPPWGLNAFRFPLATHIFMYGLINAFFLNKKSGWVFIFLSPLVHFSFFLAILTLFIFKVLGNRIKAYVVLLLFSLIPFFSLQTSSLKNLLPQTDIGAIEGRKGSYLDEEYIARDRAGAATMNWYVGLRYTGAKYATVFLILFTYIRRKNIPKDDGLYSMLCYSIFLMGFSNLLDAAMASIGRFTMVAQMLFLAVFFIYSSRYVWRLKPLYQTAFTFVVLLYTIVEIRVGFYTFSLDTVLSNPILVAFLGQSGIHLDWLLKPIR